MKKSIVLVISILAVVVLTFTACGVDSDVCDELNAMIKMDYTLVKMDVSTTTQGVTLDSSFTSQSAVNGTTVVYSVEKLASITTDSNGNYVMPSKMIETKSGSATVKNGKIITQLGDPIDIPISSLTAATLNFKSNYFASSKSSVEGTEKTLEATVSDIKGFTGNANFDGKNMTVQVKYNQKLSVITIDYLSNNGALVKVIYTFR